MIPLRQITSCLNGRVLLADVTGPAWAPRRDFAKTSVLIDPRHRFQTFLGFGGALTEAAGDVLSRLSAERAQDVIRAYFDPSQGHGYTLARTHLNSCDFSLGNYSISPTNGDVGLAHLDWSRPETFLFPWMIRARDAAGGKLQFVLSPWSPAPWMKTTGRMNGGGKLKAESRSCWAQCYVRFIEACRARGLEVFGVTVQNEPNATQRWDSCDYTAEEERDFIRDHLGPALRSAGMPEVRIIIWDHNRDLMVHRSSVIFSDLAASEYIWGTGFHWYDDSRFENVRLHHETWPDKHLIFTEGCQEGGTHLDSWAVAERYATSIMKDLNHWTEAWLDWNVVLDETGGPNHVGNMCSAPIIADTQKEQLLYQPSYFYLGHFARYIRPGARRILCASTKDRIEATAFQNADGTIAVVALNTQPEGCVFDLYLGEREATVQLPARGITTLVIAPEA